MFDVRLTTVRPSTTDTGAWTIGPNGEFNPGFVRNSVAQAFNSSNGFKLKMSSSAFGVVITSTVMALFTAIFLLVAGILTLRGNATGRIFKIYAGVRIVLAIVSGFGWFALIDSVRTSSGMTPGPAAAFDVGCALGIASLIYPCIVLALMRAESTREYFAAAGTT